MGRVLLGVVGGHRGDAFRGALSTLSDRVRLVAVCDIREAVLARWRADYPGIQTFTDYDRMLGESECTAVFVATPVPVHAEQAIKAMRSGRDVLSEVTAAQTMDECWALVEAVESTGRTYMLAENYCYMRENMAVLRMVQEGLFGDPYYAEGGYIHAVPDLFVTEDGALTWRGELVLSTRGNRYPTHSLGPVAQWLGTARGGQDHLVETATFTSTGRSVERYLARNLPESSNLLDLGFQLDDNAITVIRSERGKLIVLRVDFCSPRPHNMAHYALQGSAGAYLSGRHEGEGGLLWIESRSPATPTGVTTEWEDFSNFLPRYEHPLWQQWGEIAQSAGHGGGDFFVLLDFIASIEKRTEPPIDVYDAVTWSCIVPLSERSLAAGSAPVEIPDFRRGRDQDHP